MQDNDKIKKELGCLKAYRDKDKSHDEDYKKRLLGDKPKEGEY